MERMKADALPLGNDALEVDPTPARDAVDLRSGPASTIRAN
jgi:hypothetical protein